MSVTDMSTLLYLAYGSNLHPVRLSERVPSARLLGPVSLPGYRLAFNVRGQDRSGKGNLVSTADASHTAYGAVYEIAAAHKPDLDRYEGESYRVTSLEVTLAGGRYRCFTYIANESHVDETLRPYDWYTTLIALGARYVGVPTAYLDIIHGAECLPDPDAGRSDLHRALIDRMANFAA
jgi:gamma-glutamylcyclotransferase